MTDHSDLIERLRDRIAGPHVAVPLKIVERIRAYRASQPYDPVLSQIEIDMNIALAPVPASGGVDAVAAVVAEELALKIVSLSVNWLREDGTDREHENYVRANWTKEIAEAKRLILAALSPAATPVSEAGGEVDWLVEHLLSWPCTGDERDGKSEAYINGLMRQAARRIEALAKPASSPAGGDVVQTLIDKTEKLIEAADDMGWSCNSSSADQAIREAKDAVRAALSQSTSAGRVG